ncbi:MAG: hypothetical protein HY211_01595 [Candidatus Omnitrophica bacterium]|nr:hypothetical protein [Candidatus Omnitrophota bacterium]
MRPPLYGQTFLRTFKRLDRQRQQAALEAVQSFLTYLEERKQLPAGLGLKKLAKAYWEIRTTLADRVVFEWLEDQVAFRLVGSHDDVRRFLRQS